MTQEVLDGADVGSGFQQVGGERVPKSARCDALGDGGFADGIANLAGHGVAVQVVVGYFSGAWVGAEGGCGEAIVARTPINTQKEAQRVGNQKDGGTGGIRTLGSVTTTFP